MVDHLTVFLKWTRYKGKEFMVTKETSPRSKSHVIECEIKQFWGIEQISKPFFIYIKYDDIHIIREILSLKMTYKVFQSCYTVF